MTDEQVGDAGTPAREYFMTTPRLGFGLWDQDRDAGLAQSLWGDLRVMKLLSGPGGYSAADVAERLAREVRNQAELGMCYWPLFLRETGAFVGCCGLKPGSEGRLEVGYQLRPEFWGRGLAKEATRAAIERAFRMHHVDALQGIHHPDNTASGNVLKAFGFRPVGTEYYPPTGRMHIFYVLPRSDFVVPPPYHAPDADNA